MLIRVFSSSCFHLQFFVNTFYSYSSKYYKFLVKFKHIHISTGIYQKVAILYTYLCSSYKWKEEFEHNFAKSLLRFSSNPSYFLQIFVTKKCYPKEAPPTYAFSFAADIRQPLTNTQQYLQSTPELFSCFIIQF